MILYGKWFIKRCQFVQFSIGERNVPKRYVILKDRNGRRILDEILLSLDMMEPYISSIQSCHCGSDIYM